MRNFLINALRMLCIMAYAIATIAGIGNCCMIGEYVTAVAILILAIMAWPVAYRFGVSIGDDK